MPIHRQVHCLSVPEGGGGFPQLNTGFGFGKSLSFMAAGPAVERHWHRAEYQQTNLSITWRGFMLRTTGAIVVLLVGMCYSGPVAAQSPPSPNVSPPWEQGKAFSFVGVVDT